MTSEARGRIPIDKNIPLPPLRARNTDAIGGSEARYPWADMVPGDSFFAPNTTTHQHGRARGLKHLTTSSGRRAVPGSEWACRSVTKGGVQGVRVWRVK